MSLPSFNDLKSLSNSEISEKIIHKEIAEFELLSEVEN